MDQVYFNVNIYSIFSTAFDDSGSLSIFLSVIKFHIDGTFFMIDNYRFGTKLALNFNADMVSIYNQN